MSAAEFARERDECRDVIRELLPLAMEQLERMASCGGHEHAQAIYDRARSTFDVGYRIAMKRRAARLPSGGPR